MTKINAPGINCWQAFLACMMDLPIGLLQHCSTDNDDWKQKTDEVLARFETFSVEVKPDEVTALPAGMIVGANTLGPNGRPHIVCAEVVRDQERQSFIIQHDPSGFYAAGTPLDPPTIVLICRLIKWQPR